MDLSKFLFDQRETLLVADYDTYRAQLSRQILAIRRRLGLATNKREKFANREITAADVGKDREYARLLFLTAERAWAHAMHIKSVHTDDVSHGGTLTGSSKGHIVSRLDKGTKIAWKLVQLLENQQQSTAGNKDILDARAYHCTLAGARQFEKLFGNPSINREQWYTCLQDYAVARTIYATLFDATQLEAYKDFLGSTIDPTVRYAAYQARLPRTMTVAAVAKRFFPNEDEDLVRQLHSIDEHALKDKPDAQSPDQQIDLDPKNIPSNIVWRGRKADIVDASIGQSIAATTAAERRLQAFLSANSSASAKDKAAMYDDVLNAAQEAADATKSATDELEKEKVEEGDARMQDLRVTSLAVNYELISWRVGRNRILTGSDDGMRLNDDLAAGRLRRSAKSQSSGKHVPRNRRLAQLRERVVLYNASIQSIESIKELRGALRDAPFVKELNGQIGYFRAVKCLNIAYSHELIGNHIEALALLQRAHDLINQVRPEASPETTDTPPKLSISSASIGRLQEQIASARSRARAKVEPQSSDMAFVLPIQDLQHYAGSQVQAGAGPIVDYPPKTAPVPVKPLFLDIAWNYIDYPGQQAAQLPIKTNANTHVPAAAEEKAPERKKGWFGFGR